MDVRGPRIPAVAATALGVVVAVAFGAGAAWAHVNVQPPSLPKGASDVIFSFSTPNEATNGANVTGLEVDFPTNTPLLSALAQTKAGWDATVTTAKLPKPVTTDDGTFTTAVTEVTWMVTAGGGVPPGAFERFNVLATTPSSGTKVTFKAIQTYSNGDVVRWIETPVKGAPKPENPAPVLTLTKAPPSGG